MRSPSSVEGRRGGRSAAASGIVAARRQSAWRPCSWDEYPAAVAFGMRFASEEGSASWRSRCFDGQLSGAMTHRISSKPATAHTPIPDQNQGALVPRSALARPIPSLRTAMTRARPISPHPASRMTTSPHHVHHENSTRGNACSSHRLGQSLTACTSDGRGCLGGAPAAESRGRTRLLVRSPSRARPYPFAAAILAGTKTAEVRRRFPDQPAGTKIYLYSSSPERAVIGTASLDSADRPNASDVWDAYGHVIAIARQSLDAYLGDVPVPAILQVRSPVRWEVPMPLSELRSQVLIEPPQSFRYIDSERAALLDAWEPRPRSRQAMLV